MNGKKLIPYSIYNNKRVIVQEIFIAHQMVIPRISFNFKTNKIIISEMIFQEALCNNLFDSEIYPATISINKMIFTLDKRFVIFLHETSI